VKMREVVNKNHLKSSLEESFKTDHHSMTTDEQLKNMECLDQYTLQKNVTKEHILNFYFFLSAKSLFLD